MSGWKPIGLEAPMTGDPVLDQLLKEHESLSRRHERYTTVGSGSPMFAAEIRSRLDGVEASMIEIRRMGATERHSQWEDIETAPKDGRMFLAYNAAMGAYTTSYTTRWIDGTKTYKGFPCGFHGGMFGAWDCQPTHWMPLPSAPLYEEVAI